MYTLGDIEKIRATKKIGMVKQLTGSHTSYADAGVYTERAEEGLHKIVERVRKTWIPAEGIGSVKLDIGQFANIIQFSEQEGLCITTDGVGSKALIATLLGSYDTIGIDCVAMNVNDILCVGARPLSLVDYIAVRDPDPRLLDALASGLCDGAAQAGISVSGGEIAQLPDMLAEHKYGHTFDLVGTAVGIVSLDKIVVGQDIQEGDVVVGIESSGVHSNGLSLARHVFFAKHGLTADTALPGLERSLGAELLTPTYIYAKEVLTMLEEIVGIKALVHITGDGFLNLTRVQSNVGYHIDHLPEPPPIFSLIQEYGDVTDEEMFRVYNMGVGFCVVVREDGARAVASIAERYGKKAYVIGRAVNDHERRVVITQKRIVGKGKKFAKMKEETGRGSFTGEVVEAR